MCNVDARGVLVAVVLALLALVLALEVVLDEALRPVPVAGVLWALFDSSNWSSEWRSEALEASPKCSGRRELKIAATCTII